VEDEGFGAFDVELGEGEGGIGEEIVEAGVRTVEGEDSAGWRSGFRYRGRR